jgi:carbon-monoxide dehydrogenase medium subunit
LDAEIVAATSSGTRTIPAREFFVDMLTTQLKHGEILTQVRVPVMKPRTGGAYEKLFQRHRGLQLLESQRF